MLDSSVDSSGCFNGKSGFLQYDKGSVDIYTHKLQVGVTVP